MHNISRSSCDLFRNFYDRKDSGFKKLSQKSKSVTKCSNTFFEKYQLVGLVANNDEYVKRIKEHDTNQPLIPPLSSENIQINADKSKPTAAEEQLSSI